MSDLLVLRHGETEWSRTGRHTGRTDLPLTPFGEQQARTAGSLLAYRHIRLVLVSPLRRARRTAELAGLTDLRQDPDLREWDYGGYEGISTAEIRTTRPDWDLWTDGVPAGDASHPGENVEQVGARADRVLQRVDEVLRQDGAQGKGDVVLVAHSHVLRVLTARRLGLPPTAGACFQLGTAAMGRFGVEHGRPVITGWNLLPLVPGG